METDWLELWRRMVIENLKPAGEGLYKRYEAHTRKRSERPDPLLDFVLQNLETGDSVIDIGAGSGRWTLPIARSNHAVTAVEPADAMSELLKNNLREAGISGVQVISTNWEQVEVAPHDVAVCAHAMYSSPDLASFVRKMEIHARKRCYLAIRLPPVDSILAELSLTIYGGRHDSPNAIIAYNALYMLGIYASVLVEDEILKWQNASFEEAFWRAKRHLHLESSSTYDSLIRETLQRRLVLSGDSYIWPDGMRSALLWWKPHRL